MKLNSLKLFILTIAAYSLILLPGAQAQDLANLPNYFSKKSPECKQWEKPTLSPELKNSCGKNLTADVQAQFDQLAALKLHADLQKLYLEKAYDRIRQMSVIHRAYKMPFPKTPDFSEKGCRAAHKLGTDLKIKKLKDEYHNLNLSDEDARNLKRRQVAALFEFELSKHEWMGAGNREVVDRRDRLSADFPQLYFSSFGHNPLANDRRNAFMALMKVIDEKLVKGGQLVPRGDQQIRFNEYSLSRREGSKFVDSQIFPEKGMSMTHPPSIQSGRSNNLGDRLFEILSRLPDREIPKEVDDYLKAATLKVSDELPNLVSNICGLDNCFGDGKSCDEQFCKLATLNKQKTTMLAFLDYPSLREAYSRDLCRKCGDEGFKWTDAAIIGGELILNGTAAASCIQANPACAVLGPAAVAVNSYEALKQVKDALIAREEVSESRTAAMAGIVSGSAVDEKKSEMYTKFFWAALAASGAYGDLQLLKSAQESRSMARALEMLTSMNLIKIDAKGAEAALRDPAIRKKLLDVASCKL